MLSDNELAELREMQERNMPETVTRRRQVLADDGHGGFTTTSSDLATTGRIGPTGRSPEEQVIAARVTGKQVYTITLPYGFDVTEPDQLIIGSRTFEVVGVVRRSIETARRVVATEVM